MNGVCTKHGHELSTASQPDPRPKLIPLSGRRRIAPHNSYTFSQTDGFFNNCPAVVIPSYLKIVTGVQKIFTTLAPAPSFERMAALAAELQHLLSVLHGSPLCHNWGELFTATTVVFSACVPFIKATALVPYVPSCHPGHEHLYTPVSFDGPWPPHANPQHASPTTSPQSDLSQDWLDQAIAAAINRRSEITTAMAELRASIGAYECPTPTTIHAPHMTFFDK